MLKKLSLTLILLLLLGCTNTPLKNNSLSPKEQLLEQKINDSVLSCLVPPLLRNRSEKKLAIFILSKSNKAWLKPVMNAFTSVGNSTAFSDFFGGLFR